MSHRKIDTLFDLRLNFFFFCFRISHQTHPWEIAINPYSPWSKPTVLRAPPALYASSSSLQAAAVDEDATIGAPSMLRNSVCMCVCLCVCMCIECIFAKVLSSRRRPQPGHFKRWRRHGRWGKPIRISLWVKYDLPCSQYVRMWT